MWKNLIILTFIAHINFAQDHGFKGRVLFENQGLEHVSIALKGTRFGTLTNENGEFTISNVPQGEYVIEISAVGYLKKLVKMKIPMSQELIIELEKGDLILDEVVVSGTLKEVSRLDSPVPVEVFTAKFFKSNPSPSIFDALQNVNGVRPQINCSVCNTGDIHINGLEGPYTMVLIDGMPLVSGLSTVYGLSGIPQSLIERVEVVKGPASTLYGSEAVGGLINIITKSPLKAPTFAVDAFSTTWGEINADISGKMQFSPKVKSLLGVNYFIFQNPIDHNQDQFTDLTQQHRISVFNKWDLEQANGRHLSFAGRYLYEDRWGGDTRWNSSYRGGDEIYGESIYTQRWEAFGNYAVSTRWNVMFSANWHQQNSVYGQVPYLAQQNIYFGQTTYGDNWGKHDVLAGLAYRYTFYDDHTPATFLNGSNHTHLPGIFLQDEFKINANHTLMMGLRYDYNSIHGSIFSPRINYKWKNKNTVFRLGAGNGFRVANVFTEDHAALTGAREVVFLENLNPETSWNVNANWVQKFYLTNGTYINLDATAFFTRFNNKIIPDYDTDPQQIIYANLEGHAVSRGISMNVDVAFPMGLKAVVGATAMDVFITEDGVKQQQMFTERFTSTWTVGYTFSKSKITLDYTGNLFGPMRLPILGHLDPRPDQSPWWSIQNVQVTKNIKDKWEIYGGVKNLLNWTPNKGLPFVIARSHDPFNREVEFDEHGGVIPTSQNPYALTFDPTYVYASNQGIRGFLGLRFTLK